MNRSKTGRLAWRRKRLGSNPAASFVILVFFRGDWWSSVTPSYEAVVIRAQRRSRHEFAKHPHRHTGMVIGAPAVELDGQRINVVIHGTDRGGIDGDHILLVCSWFKRGFQPNSCLGLARRAVWMNCVFIGNNSTNPAFHFSGIRQLRRRQLDITEV